MRVPKQFKNSILGRHVRAYHDPDCKDRDFALRKIKDWSTDILKHYKNYPDGHNAAHRKFYSTPEFLPWVRELQAASSLLLHK